MVFSDSDDTKANLITPSSWVLCNTIYMSVSVLYSDVANDYI